MILDKLGCNNKLNFMRKLHSYITSYVATLNCKILFYKASLLEASSFTELHHWFTYVFHAGKAPVI